MSDLKKLPLTATQREGVIIALCLASVLLFFSGFVFRELALTVEVPAAFSPALLPGDQDAQAPVVKHLAPSRRHIIVRV